MTYHEAAAVERLRVFETRPHLVVVGDKDISKRIVCNLLGRPNVRKLEDKIILKCFIKTTIIQVDSKWCCHVSVGGSHRTTITDPEQLPEAITLVENSILAEHHGQMSNTPTTINLEIHNPDYLYPNFCFIELPDVIAGHNSSIIDSFITQYLARSTTLTAVVLSDERDVMISITSGKFRIRNGIGLVVTHELGSEDEIELCDLMKSENKTSYGMTEGFHILERDPAIVRHAEGIKQLNLRKSYPSDIGMANFMTKIFKTLNTM